MKIHQDAKGATMYYSGPAFTAAKIGSHHVSPSNENPHWTQLDCTPPYTEVVRDWAKVRIYDENGTEITVEANENLAQFTEISIIIPHDIELIGGAFAVPNVLPTGDESYGWHVWVYAAPEIPSALGGKIPMVEDIKLNGFYEGEDIVIDGRTPKILKYTDVSNQPVAQYGANLGNANTIATTNALAFGTATDLDNYLSLISYDGTGFSTGDILVLSKGLSDTNAWESYKYNGGTAGTSADFDSSINDFGSGDVDSAMLDLAWFSNELRFIIKHPKGLSPSSVSSTVAEFQVILDTFIKW